MGKAATGFFRWKLKGDTTYKSLFCNPAEDPTLIKLGFRIESKNGMC
jgi:hypothetical protein